MQSQRRNGLVYPVETGIAEHDDDIDAELITLESHTVYCGAIDPRYTEHELDVHWLYDDLLHRVGLVEYESADRSTYSVLWIHDNPYATFFQEPGWVCREKTVWAFMTNEAYQECVDKSFEEIVEASLYSGTLRIILPSMLPNIPRYIYECAKCGTRSLSAPDSCQDVKKALFPSSVLFLDGSGVIYDPPTSSRVWRMFTAGARRRVAGYPAPQPEQEQEPE